MAKLGFAGDYSSANWPPFIGGQNSILNWVLKLSPLHQKIKSNKNVETAWREPYLFYFVPLGVINGVESPYKKKKYSPENETCVHGRRLFLSYFF